MNNYNYKIANLNLSICGGSTAELTDKLQGFDLFRTQNTEQSDIIIKTDCNSIRETEYNNAEVLIEFTVETTTHTLSKFGEKLFFELRNKEDYSVLLCHNKNTNIIEMESCNDKFMLRFMLWAAYTMVAMRKGVMPIHASTIVFENKCLLFLGKSGAGKSTHSQQWLKHISGSFLLNDDSPMLRINGDKLFAYGTPWSGKTPCYKNKKYEIKSLINIIQHTENEIKKLSDLASIASVYSSFPTMFFTDEFYIDYMSDMVSVVVESVPIYTLKCLPNADAAITVCNKLYKHTL